MSQSGDGSDADAEADAKAPPKASEPGSAAAAAPEPISPPDRASQSLIDLHAQPTYPDDGPLSRALRKLDGWIGVGEQALLFGVLALVVVTASANAIIEKITERGLWWSYDVVRGGTFAVAMMGAAFATHQQRHLAMDLVSRRLPPRARLALTSLLLAFTMLICVVLLRSGLHQISAAGDETGRHLLEAKQISAFLPLGAAMIIVHAALHLIINIDYLVRGKLLPERARTGH